MAYKTLIFGTDDLYLTLKPFYDKEVERGNLEIIATAELEGDTVNLVYADGRRGGGIEDIQNFDLAIISSWKYFYPRMKMLEAHGFQRNRILDGGVFFQTSDLDFQRLINEGVAYSTLEKFSFSDVAPGRGTIGSIHPRVYKTLNNKVTLKLDTKGYINSGTFICHGEGLISVGKFSPISVNVQFKISINGHHDYQKIFNLTPDYFGFTPIPRNFWFKNRHCEILIGNDVWIGRESIFMSNNPNKPLIIGDGAVIASNSVVVKNVPPYAIVGGNPAKVIKYRFPPHVIKALLRIKWWDWSLDKIHDNFKYFNDIEKFISLHDPLKDSDAPQDENILGYDIENTFDLDTDKICNNFR